MCPTPCAQTPFDDLIVSVCCRNKWLTLAVSPPPVRANACHDSFYLLSKKAACAYGLYACSSVLLPNLVTALVLFYGGTLVIQGQITGGKVLSFMIYLTSLSGGFNQMAFVFSSM